MMSNNMDADCRKRTARVNAERGLAALGNSDAHHEDVLGICYTEFAQPITSMRDLVEAIRSRQTTARSSV
jgi:hypothetical protein